MNRKSYIKIRIPEGVRNNYQIRVKNERINLQENETVVCISLCETNGKKCNYVIGNLSTQLAYYMNGEDKHHPDFALLYGRCYREPDAVYICLQTLSLTRFRELTFEVLIDDDPNRVSEIEEPKIELRITVPEHNKGRSFITSFDAAGNRKTEEYFPHECKGDDTKCQ